MGTYFILKIPRNTFYLKNETCRIECESLGSQSRFSIFKIIWFKKRCLKWIESWLHEKSFSELNWYRSAFDCKSWKSHLLLFLEIIKCMTLLCLDSIVLYLWLQALLGDHLADGVGGDDIHSFKVNENVISCYWNVGHNEFALKVIEFGAF